MTELREIHLFPLHEVMFPGGRMDLQIFERRYIDLVSHCLKNNSGFGVCLLQRGEETMQLGRKQTVHSTGTYASIADWDQLPNGLLGITIEGSGKFKIEKCWQDDSGVLKALVHFSTTDSVDVQLIPLAKQFSELVELLHKLGDHPLVEKKQLTINYNNLWHLGWRLSELIPVELEKKQELLELDDPWERIESIKQLVADLGQL
jgi:Lon protease-like protein